MNNHEIFENLFSVINERKKAIAGQSYVASLMAKGTAKINSKILEEAAEVCESALEENKAHLIYEICDLLFHTFVLAGYKEIKLADITEELARRFGTSGLKEKAERNNNDK